MLKEIGKWAAKKAVGVVVGGIIRSVGGGTVAQEVGKIAVNEAIDQVLGN